MESEAIVSESTTLQERRKKKPLTSLAPEYIPVERIKQDIRLAASTMSEQEARYLVDLYYMMQENRKAAANQVRALGENTEPNATLAWVAGQAESLEAQVKKALGTFSQSRVVGQWAESIVGIGPVISAGLIANIDIEKAPTVGHIWRFAGVDPTVRWEKGQKRPWNASLKTLVWKIGDSFVKFHNHERDIYGKVYVARKEYEVARNERGDNAEYAARALETKRWRPETEAFKAYSVGKLPAGQIDARAKRYAAKLFLAHLHHVMYEDRYGVPPPLPYILTQPGHVHFIAPPGWPL